MDADECVDRWMGAASDVMGVMGVIRAVRKTTCARAVGCGENYLNEETNAVHKTLRVGQGRTVERVDNSSSHVVMHV